MLVRHQAKLLFGNKMARSSHHQGHQGLFSVLFNNMGTHRKFSSSQRVLSADIQQRTSSNDEKKGQSADNTFTFSWYKLLIPLSVASVWLYIKQWEKKPAQDFEYLKGYINMYKDQLKEQAFQAGVESLTHGEHRQLMDELIAQSSETGNYLVEVGKEQQRPIFDLNIQSFKELKTHKPHPFINGRVKYALLGELWYLEPTLSSTKLHAFGKKCFDSRDISLVVHFPIKVMPKPHDGSVLGHLEDKVLTYLVMNVEMKAIEKDFVSGTRPDLTISKISIAPITSHYETVSGLREQRLFDEIEVEKALAPNGIHHATDGLHNKSFSWNIFI